MKCPSCNNELKAGETFCLSCRRPKIPTPKDRPVRTFDVELNDLLGWPEEKVIATLGLPDSKSVGRLWPPNDQHDSEITIDEEGHVKEVRPFGPRQYKIPFPTPYETWDYVVPDSTWLIYLIGASDSGKATTWNAEPVDSSRSDWLQNLISFFRLATWQTMAKRQRVVEEKLKPKGPLVVADVSLVPHNARY